MNVRTRPETQADAAFVRSLILETISEELGAAAWPEPMRSHLLEIQYRGRRHPDGEIIVADESNVGWMAIAFSADEVRLVEIMVRPEKQRTGIGSAAITELIQRAAGRPVRLHVRVGNAGAIRLYERLGFRVIASDPVQHFMERI